MSHLFKSVGIFQISGAVYPSLPEIVVFGIGVSPLILANPKSHIFIVKSPEINRLSNLMSP